MAIPKDLATLVSKFRRIHGRRPLHYQQEAALQKMDDNVTAGENLINLIGKRRVARETDAKLNARSLWDKLVHPVSDANVRRQAEQGTDSLRHLNQDINSNNKNIDRVNNLFRELIDNKLTQRRQEFRFNPTDYRHLPEEINPLGWRIESIPRVNTAAGTKEYQNLPKYIRNAYEAGHYVNPDPAWGMKEMTRGNTLGYKKTR